MDQNNKQNTDDQGDQVNTGLPSMSKGSGDVKKEELLDKTSKPEVVAPVKTSEKAPEISKTPEISDEMAGGLPPLATAEDETFNPKDTGKVVDEVKEVKKEGGDEINEGGDKANIEKEPIKMEEVDGEALSPLPNVDVGEIEGEGLKEVKEINEVNDVGQETPPPSPPEVSPVVPGEEDKPVVSEGVDMSDGGEGKKESKGKKNNKGKMIAGGIVALVLLVGVPLLALNLDYFRGDVRERAMMTSGETCREDSDCNGSNMKCRSGECVYVVPYTPRPTNPASGNLGRETYTPAPTNLGRETYTPAPTNPASGNLGRETACVIDGNTCGGEGLPDEECCTSTFECAVVDGYTGIKKCVLAGSTPTPTSTAGSGGTTVSDSGAESDEGSVTKSGSNLACVGIKAYTLRGGVWTETSFAGLGQYAGVGDTVRFALRGNSSTFVRAQFGIVINGVSSNWIETRSKNDAGELYIDYKLEHGGTYSIVGELQDD